MAREKPWTPEQFRHFAKTGEQPRGSATGRVTAHRIEFVVPGKPQPKQRARKGRGGRWYTPEETVAFEKRVAEHFKMVAGKHEPWTGDVLVGVTAYGAHHAADSSNIRKAVEDGLNKVAYRDDVQIVDGYDGKRPAGDEGPRTVIVVMKLEQGGRADG